MHFHSQERSKMATYCSSIPECCVPEVKVSLIVSALFRRNRLRGSFFFFFFYPHMSALNLCDAGYSGSSQARLIKEQGMAQWSERLPPEYPEYQAFLGKRGKMTQASLPPMWPGFKSRRRRHYDATKCALSLLLVSPLLREVFLLVLRFSPLLKNQHFQIPIRPGIR